MAVTQKHLAELLGMTRATVCRSLRQDNRISAKTRKAVNDLASQLGYKPNLIARGLKGGSTKTIGIVWPLTGASRTTDAVHLLALGFQKKGYLTSIVDSFGAPVLDEAGTRLLYRQLPSALSATLDDFQLRGVDVVVIDWRYGCMTIPDELQAKFSSFTKTVVVTMVRQELEVDQVVHDRRKAYMQVAQHFAKTGRKRPALLNSNGSEENRINIDVFVDTLRKFDIDLPFRSVIHLDMDFFGMGLSITEKTHIELDSKFSRSKWPFDAVFCANDETALSLMNWLGEHDIRVPDDVAVVGFNNIDVASAFNPPLASVERNDIAVAEEVTECILGCAGTDGSLQFLPKFKTVEMEFVYRNSAG